MFPRVIAIAALIFLVHPLHALRTSTGNDVLPIVPGMHNIGLGYNVVTNLTGWPVVNYSSFEQGTTVSVGGKQFRVPDWVYAKQVAPRSVFENSTKIYENLASVQNEWKEVLHWHSGFLGMVSHTEIIEHVIDKMYTDGDGYVEAKMDFKALWLDASDTVMTADMLDQHFVSQLRALPKQFNNATYNATTNPQGYHAFKRFFGNYGVSVVTAAYMGGMLRMKRWYNSCFVKQNSLSWVYEQSGWSFLGIISHHSQSSKWTKRINQRFLKNTQLEWMMIGGNQSLQKPNKWGEWKDTIAYLPEAMQPVQMHVTPIHRLVKWFEPSFAAALENATFVYLLEAQQALEAQIAEKKRHQAPEPKYCKGH